MILVSNTGPLIGLAKLGRLDLIPTLASAAFVPPQVEAEVLAKTGLESALLANALRSSIQVKSPGPLQPVALGAIRHLDEGERQAIALAITLPPPVLLLLDDRAGRNAAGKLGQPVTGLGGFLLLAKQRGLVSEVGPLLTQLRANGYWLSDRVLEYLRQLAAE